MDVLKSILAQEDTVLFIGSGVSIWSGLPSWKAMISNLSDFIERNGGCSELVNAEATHGDLLQAASYGFDNLTNQQMGEFIRESCKYGVAKPAPIHEKIVTLGPTCFVTTNYDNLIEESVRKWLPNKFFRPPVTNRHLTETAEIVHARSSNFVFKPHGDAADTESIILTREQYRKLLPGGERYAALETVKLLLVSRPVVYIGFGLRDPDFIYIRDLLANTYKGGIRDHYAIMADVSLNEANYWRNNYGIHLISYNTNIDQQGNRSHNGLLELLDNLKEPILSQPEADKLIEEESQEFPPQNVLSLARHAGRLSEFLPVTPELLLRVKLTKMDNDGELLRKRNRYTYHDYAIDRILGEGGPTRAIVTGLPGAGKSYSIKKSVANLANKLNKVCLQEEFHAENVIIPIYADLKLYEGNIRELISKSLVSSLNFNDLDNRFKMRLFLDSFNEIPREFMESGICEKDIFSFINELKNCDVIISSRTNDGLNKINFPVYCLESIDYSYVESEVNNMKVSFDKRFKHEVLSMLQKPFFFSLFVNKKIKLPEKYNPVDLYNSYFENIENLFLENHGFSFDLKACLSKIAYESLNKGIEALPLQIVLQFIKVQLRYQKVTSINEAEIANWLVSKNLLIPYIHNKIAFFHQSITEYLAATELANKYQINRDVLREILENTRWDQALFFTLPLLPTKLSESFLNDVMDVDLQLAIKASKYMELGRAKIVEKLLKGVISNQKKYGYEYGQIEYVMKNSLIVEEQHSDLLFKIVNFKNSIGGVACILLDSIRGEALKEYYMNFFITDKNDYNFLANGVSRVLKKYIHEVDIDDIQKLIDKVSNDELEDSKSDKLEGFVSGIVNLLESVDLEPSFRS